MGRGDGGRWGEVRRRQVGGGKEEGGGGGDGGRWGEVMGAGGGR